MDWKDSLEKKAIELNLKRRKQMKLSLYLRIGAIVAGVITAGVFLKLHPIPIILLVVEAGTYFVGEYLRKQGN